MKRRLQLMPEVLPAPTKVDPSGPSAVRTRTMARLRSLAAVGAAMTTGIASACGGGSTSPSGSGGPDGGLPDGTKPDSDPGYGVVDPLPRPTCFEKQAPTLTVGFVTAEDAGADGSADPDGGSLYQAAYVRLVLKFTQSDVAVGEIRVDASGSGAPLTVVEQNVSGSSVELVLRKTPGADNISATVSIQTSCSTGPTSVQVQLTESLSGDVTGQLTYY